MYHGKMKHLIKIRWCATELGLMSTAKRTEKSQSNHKNWNEDKEGKGLSIETTGAGSR